MPVNIDLHGFNGQIAVHQIAPKTLHDDNEDAEKVTINENSFLADKTLALELPAHSVTALEWPQQ